MNCSRFTQVQRHSRELINYFLSQLSMEINRTSLIRHTHSTYRRSHFARDGLHLSPSGLLKYRLLLHQALSSKFQLPPLHHLPKKNLPSPYLLVIYAMVFPIIPTNVFSSQTDRIDEHDLGRVEGLLSNKKKRTELVSLFRAAVSNFPVNVMDGYNNNNHTHSCVYTPRTQSILL